MAQTTQITIDNQTFPSFRSKLNESLSALNTLNSGTSRPSSAVAGTIWLDTTSATNPTLKFYDGADDISLATIDYSANTVNWLDSSVTLTSPVSISGSASAGAEIRLPEDTDNGSHYVGLKASDSIASDITFTLPSADGTADQVLKTDGSGNLSFTDVSGGTDWQSSIKTSAFTAVAGEGYWINTTSGAVTMTLPASASVGDTIEFVDYARTWGTNAVTLNTNSLNFQGGTTPNPVYNTNGQSVKIIYSGASKGWIPSVDDDVTLETPQNISADILIVAGGGGGSSGSAGGGGAGGLVYASSVLITPGESKTVTVGAGGSGTTGESSVNGSNGNDSSFTGQTTAVGGGGGGHEDGNGSSGGSGGGGGINGTAGSGTVGQGNDGGDGFYAGNYGAGGGGGAGTAGGDATSTTGGNGGDGVNTYSTFATATSTGDSGYYAGGGGGSVRTGTQGTGGSGGGTDGVPNNGTASNATANTGGGGGGAGESGTGGNGGSGIVIVRYSDTNGQLGTGGTVTQSSGYYYHAFTSSGTFTNTG